MNNKLINSQLTNFKTYLLYKDYFTSLAENVLTFRNLPKTIDRGFLNRELLQNNSIAFFNDDVLGILALPYSVILYDVYNMNPEKIQIIMPNGYHRVLRKDDFVIMYDNLSRKNIYKHVLQFAERVSFDTRVSDINISQQKTPRITSVPQDKKQSFIDAIKNIDSFNEIVLAYENLDIEGINSVLSPAPFVADKIDEHKQRIIQEFLSFIGITSVQIEKKERLLSNEVESSLGLNYASRFNRFEARKEAIEQINKKFKLNIEVCYYDEIPKYKKEGEKDVSNTKLISNSENKSEATDNI